MSVSTPRRSRTARPHAATSTTRIVELLGREPNLTELGLFSVMWSEHCSYKSSRVHLRTLPTEGPRVVQGPGENAGAVDIGDGLAAVFKIESHNHPSFIEPYQGAATGVGGIIRDIFTMGARPIALLDALRFGPLDEPRNRRILQGVVAGIGGYGNSIGIPTVGGEVMFDETYSGNPLVNVFCLGIAKHDALVKGTGERRRQSRCTTSAPRPAATAFTARRWRRRSSTSKSAEKRPGRAGRRSVHGEAAARGVPRGDGDRRVRRRAGHGRGRPDVRDVARPASRGGVGVEIDVAHVPQRETGMTPYEIMLSESQERMLLIVKRGREAEVERIFEKWDLHAVRIGEVTDDGRAARASTTACVVADVPNRALTDEAPVYRRPMQRAGGSRRAARRFPRARAAAAAAPARRAADAARRRRRSRASAGSTSSTTTWCARTRSRWPGMGAGVVRVKGTNRALAMSVDGNGRFVLLDPRQGARLALAEAARNVACAGGAADRRDQLPELRQSGAARDHVAVRRSRRRASARRAARSTFRSPAATSASTTRPTASADPADAGHRRRRRASRTRRSVLTRAFPDGRARHRAARRQPRRARRQRVS